MRQRIRSKLVDSRIASRKRKKQAEEEIVVKVSKKTEDGDFFDLQSEILTDGERRRRIASALVMIGALMGILSGTLILQGNPSGLLNSSIFKSTDSLDIHGFVLDIEGEPVVNVSIDLVDPESNSPIKSSTSDENGRYMIDDVLVKEYELHVYKEGYETVILTFKPEPIGISPITMIEGDGQREKDELSQTKGWSMENAVALATVEGLLTIGCALVGVHASFEIRRKKKYRRTQYFCWISLFSRGLIIFGPALILTGMIFLMLDKQDFDDQRVEEVL